MTAGQRAAAALVPGLTAGWMGLAWVSAPVRAQPAAPAPASAPAQAVAQGDAARGRAIVATRGQGLCLMCHPAPIAEERQQGNLAPDLAGIGARLTAGELRRRLLEPKAINPETIMPSYGRSDGFERPARAFAGRPVLSAQQVEDVVAWLSSLK